MSRRRDWHPPWMTPEEWAEWKAGENDRSRRLYERAKRGHEELEARKRAAEEAEQAATAGGASSSFASRLTHDLVTPVGQSRASPYRRSPRR